jgi:hypothetical protein
LEEETAFSQPPKLWELLRTIRGITMQMALYRTLTLFIAHMKEASGAVHTWEIISAASLWLKSKQNEMFSMIYEL